MEKLPIDTAIDFYEIAFTDADMEIAQYKPVEPTFEGPFEDSFLPLGPLIRLDNRKLQWAVERNRKWAKELGWCNFTLAIKKEIGMDVGSNSEVELAQHVVSWQYMNKFVPEETDGVIGRNTWHVLKKEIGITKENAQEFTNKNFAGRQLVDFGKNIVSATKAVLNSIEEDKQAVPDPQGWRFAFGRKPSINQNVLYEFDAHGKLTDKLSWPQNEQRSYYKIGDIIAYNRRTKNELEQSYPQLFKKDENQIFTDLSYILLYILADVKKPKYLCAKKITNIELHDSTGRGALVTVDVVFIEDTMIETTTGGFWPRSQTEFMRAWQEESSGLVEFAELIEKTVRYGAEFVFGIGKKFIIKKLASKAIIENIKFGVRKLLSTIAFKIIPNATKAFLLEIAKGVMQIEQSRSLAANADVNLITDEKIQKILTSGIQAFCNTFIDGLFGMFEFKGISEFLNKYLDVSDFKGKLKKGFLEAVLKFILTNFKSTLSKHIINSMLPDQKLNTDKLLNDVEKDFIKTMKSVPEKVISEQIESFLELHY